MRDFWNKYVTHRDFFGKHMRLDQFLISTRFYRAMTQSGLYQDRFTGKLYNEKERPAIKTTLLNIMEAEKRVKSSENRKMDSRSV